MRSFWILVCASLLPAAPSARADRPNILWIVTEDIGPHLGCYGDAYSKTPTLDALAARGILFRHVWSSAPVCAPARTAIITGMSPTSLGAEHMRSLVAFPPELRCFPQLLRETGYYCTNNSKEDYNLAAPGRIWDESSPRAHWRNRKAGQPFFAVFNINVTHEGQIRKRPHVCKHDPAAVRIPARQPDAPDVRLDWAEYYDCITEMDGLVAQRLSELEGDALADSTIVFFYGDNGPGLPGYKRSARDSGLHVPLIVYTPSRFKSLTLAGAQAGTPSDRVVSFVDLAPTVLSLAGIRPPSWMQGRGFMGPDQTPTPEYIFGFRGRMDERCDLVRCIRDDRYIFVRNYMPHLPEGQHVAYMFETPSTQVWRRQFDEGQLTPTQRLFWELRQPRELYDLKADPDEVHNLADSREHAEILARMEKSLREHLLETHDIGFLPEADMHARCKGSTPYKIAQDPQQYPVPRVLAMADLAASGDRQTIPQLREALRIDPNAAIRYWAAMGMLIRGREAVLAEQSALVEALKDASPWVRIVASEALAQFTQGETRDRAVSTLLDAADCSKQGVYVAIQALGALDRLRPLVTIDKNLLARLPRRVAAEPNRIAEYVPRLLDGVLHTEP